MRLKNWINESGIRNIKKISKQYKKAEIWFHKDMDGVASAIAMKSYLEQNGIKVINAYPTQYGSDEFAAPKGRTDTLKALVDFAHGSYRFQIHTDHHEGQVGVDPKASTNFKKSPSGTGTISGSISPKDIFPPKDLKIINTIDSADFASQGLKPEDIFNAAFSKKPEFSVERNHTAMGLVVNKLILSYKNKPSFLQKLVMDSKPSLISMYNVIVKLAKQDGYKTISQIGKDTSQYIEAQKKKMIKTGKLSDVKTLKSGQSIQIGKITVQNNAGYMGKGNQYDRYVVFKNYPDTDYFTILWSVGILQVSQNPFKKLDKKIHLGDFVMKKVMPKFKSKLSKINVTLDMMKYTYEVDIIKKKLQGSVGFTFNDLLALYEPQLKNLPKEGTNYRDMIADITNKPYNKLSNKQKAILKKVSISAWDVIMAGSGGHPAITNLSGFNFMGKGYVDVMKDIQYEIVKEFQKL